MITALVLLLGTVILFIVLWGMYLMYVALHASMKNGKFKLTPWPVKLLSYALLGIIWPVDVLANVIPASFIFWELPSVRALTFTARCSSHLKEEGWRGDIARWVCYGWFNPFEENHCRP